MKNLPSLPALAGLLSIALGWGLWQRGETQKPAIQPPEREPPSRQADTSPNPQGQGFAYDRALKLYADGDKKAAFAWLKQRLASHPDERDTLYLFAQLALAEKRPEWFGPYLPKLSLLSESDPQAQALMESYLAEKEDPFVKSQRD